MRQDHSLQEFESLKFPVLLFLIKMNRHLHDLLYAQQNELYQKYLWINQFICILLKQVDDGNICSLLLQCSIHEHNEYRNMQKNSHICQLLYILSERQVRILLKRVLCHHLYPLISIYHTRCYIQRFLLYMHIIWQVIILFKLEQHDSYTTNVFYLNQTLSTYSFILAF